MDVGGRLRGRRVALEGAPAGKELVGDDGEGVAVAGSGRLAARRLLGGEVAGGAEHRPRGSHAGRVVHQAGDPEVDDLETVGGVEEQVRRLDVPMDDAVGVGGVQRFRGLRKPGERELRVDAPPRARTASVPPGKYSMTVNGRPSCSPTSKIVTTCGSPESLAAVSASRRKRSRNSCSSASRSARTLTATVLPSRRSRAR